MTLKTTVTTIRSLIAEMIQDLDKADRGNKAAAQRVCTTTINSPNLPKFTGKNLSVLKRNGRDDRIFLFPNKEVMLIIFPKF